MIAGLAGRAWSWLIHREREYRVFRRRPEQMGLRDAQVEVFDVAHPPDETVRGAYRIAAGRASDVLMFGRMRSAGAVLLLLRDEAGLTAFGWLQTWKPLRREFWWLDRDGIGLGPYWTRPDQRGRGLYGRLLSHSLWECDERFRGKPAYVWARSANDASVRGIEKAGFESLGEHEVSVWMGGLIRRHRSLPTT
jgi:hypothetical protein